MEKEILIWKEGHSVFKKEDQLQEAQVRWYWNTLGPDYRRMIFHVDNNSWNAIVGAKKKALGVCKGPSDLVFISYGEVIFIENKLPGEYQSDEQIDFMNKCLARGHRYVICYSFEGFKNFVLKEINRHEQ